MKILHAALFALVPSLATADTPKQVDNLGCLLGTWKATGTMTIGKDASKIDLTWTCKLASAKFGVTCIGSAHGIPGAGTYEETDLFGYEPNSDTYHWFAVTNAGETHDHVAKHAGDSGKIQFVYTGTQEGKPMKEVIDMDFAKDDKSFTLRSETFVGGQSVAVLDAKAHK